MSIVVAAVLVTVACAVALWHRVASARRCERDRCTFRVSFPHDVRAEQVAAFLIATSGIGGDVIGVDIEASDGGIVHRLAAPRRSAESIAAQLRAAIPGVRLVPEDDSFAVVGWAMELRLSNHSIPLRTDDPGATSAAVLASLSHGRHAGLAVQWAFSPKRRVRLPVPASATRSLEEGVADSFSGLVDGRQRVAAAHDLRRRIDKARTPLMHAVVRIGVRTTEDAEVLEPVFGALDSTRMPGVGFRRRPMWPTWAARRMNARRIPAVTWPVLVNATELAH
jgi:hypothetical protein